MVNLRDKIALQNQENKELAGYVQKTTADRDYYRKYSKELLETKNKIEKEKALAMETFKKRMLELDRDLKQKTDDNEENFEAK